MDTVTTKKLLFLVQIGYYPYPIFGAKSTFFFNDSPCGASNVFLRRNSPSSFRDLWDGVGVRICPPKVNIVISIRPQRIGLICAPFGPSPVS